MDSCKGCEHSGALRVAPAAQRAARTMKGRLHASVATNVLYRTQATDPVSIAENSSWRSVYMAQPLACATLARNELGKKVLEGATGSTAATIGKELGIMALDTSRFRSS